MARFAFALSLCSFLLASSSATAHATEQEAEAPKPKTLSLGAGLGYLVPVGAFAKFAGPAIGPVVRGGYRVAPRVELTLRTGFLFGLSEGSGLITRFGRDAAARVTTVPVMFGARAFLMDPVEGLYLSAESGLNIMVPASQELRLRWGANAGVGYVFDKSIPIDLHVQAGVLNLLEDMPRDQGSERTYVGISFCLGYTF